MGIFWRIAFRNLFRNGRRNLLTGSSIALGLVGICLLGGYILRMERYLAAQSIYLSLNGHIIIYAKDGLDRHLAKPAKYSLSPRDITAISEFKDSRVVRLVPELKANGLIHNGCVSFPFSSLAANPDDIKWARSSAPVEDYVKELATVNRGKGYWDASPDAINISARLADILHKEKVAGDEGAIINPGILDCSLGGEEKKKLSSDPSVQLVGAAFEGGMALADATLSGFVSSGMAFQDDTALILPFAMAQTMYGTDKVSAVAVYLERESDIPGVLKDLRQHLSAKGIKADVYPFFDENISAFYVGGMQFNWVMLYLFLLLVCSVVGISISNSLYISLMERKAELGTLRSLGFSQRSIGVLLLMENSFLLAFSFVPAILITSIVTLIVNNLNLRLTIPGLAGDIQFRLYITSGFVISVMILLSLLVLLVTKVGGRKFLRRPILDLLGTSSC